MAKLLKLQGNWKRAIKQDQPRTEMPDGSAWVLTNLIPETLEAPLEKCGGWAYGSAAASATAASYIATVAYLPALTNPTVAATLMMLDDTGKMYTVNTSSLAVTSVSSLSGAVTPMQTAFYDDRIFLPDSNGVLPLHSFVPAISEYDVVPGAPTARYVAIYRDRLVAANSVSESRRVWFSAPAAAETWDLVNSWLDVNAPVTGLAALPGALMVFKDTNTARIRGATPPPQTDMILDDPVFEVGCTDARSIATQGAVCCFANPLGVYVTNGTNLPTDLTRACGVKQPWQTLMSGYSASTWIIAGDFYQDNYVVAVMNAATFVDGYVFNLTDYTAWRKSNLTAACFANATQISEELWFGLRDEKKLGRFSTVFQPTDAVRNDGDGTAVEPVIETAFYGASPGGLKTWRNIYVEYDCAESATASNPVLTVSYVKNPEDNYTAFSPTLEETSGRVRKRIPIRFASDGIGLKIAQTNASARTRIYLLEADVHQRESSRLAQ